MTRITPLAAALSLAALTAACAPTVGVHGFQAIDAKPDEVVAGTDTKETVLARLGSPSTVSTFEPNVWYYISQRTEKYTYNLPQVAQRSVTEITFDGANDTVSGVRTLALEDGQEIAMASRVTPTRGRQLTILEQILGNVGRGQLPRTEEDTPGQQRRD